MGEEKGSCQVLSVFYLQKSARHRAQRWSHHFNWAIVPQQLLSGEQQWVWILFSLTAPVQIWRWRHVNPFHDINSLLSSLPCCFTFFWSPNPLPCPALQISGPIPAVQMKHQVESLTPLHHTMLNIFRIKMKIWERKSCHSNSTQQHHKTLRQGCSRTCQAPLHCRAVWRWQPYWAELPFVNPGITKPPTSQLESANVTPDHMKGNSSHAQGISPLSAAPCSPVQRCYFTLPQDEREGLVGTQAHWWGVLCALDIHLTCNRGAAQSSEQSKGPPNGTWADVLPACVSTGFYFQHFQLWFIVPGMFVYQTLLCSV